MILPGAFYLSLIVETSAMMHAVDPREFKVCIEDVKFVKAIFLTDAEEVELTISIQRGKNTYFEKKSVDL
jgi:Polyketide synthase dehydratase